MSVIDFQNDFCYIPDEELIDSYIRNSSLNSINTVFNDPTKFIILFYTKALCTYSGDHVQVWSAINKHVNYSEPMTCKFRQVAIFEYDDREKMIEKAQLALEDYAVRHEMDDLINDH